ncbi:hypothetical protein NQ318_018756 [Aromia moschata]|uniref:Ski2 N-terminal domain-containing protein n=1 Tax=Aromia moschata TaxID=1265417 RepID=A0AAV8ZIW8_9CUCU|nr:hypothetical protein NQ318_018756 [Aromia moschata]
MSLNREPAPPSEATRGSALYVPFWPGSFPKPTVDAPNENLLDTELLTVPPGFTTGLTFAEDGITLLKDSENVKGKPKVDVSKGVINLLDIIQQEQDLLGTWENKEEDKKEEINKVQSENVPEEEEVLPKEAPVLRISTAPPQNAPERQRMGDITRHHKARHRF